MDNYLFIPRALAAALYDLAFAAAFGLALTELWLGRNVEPALQARLRRTTFVCAAALLLALCAQAYLATATMIGASSFAQVRSQLGTVLNDTHAGRNILTVGKLALLLLIGPALVSSKKSRIRAWLILANLIAIAVWRAASGHAASDGDFTLRELVQWVHLTSIAIWAGGVMAVGVIAVPHLLRAQQAVAAHTLLRKLSATVTFALACVILSGIYNAWHGLGGSLTPLKNTQWGWLLDAKSALVLIAITLGALNRRILHKTDSLTGQDVGRLTTTLRSEAILMVLILVLSAFLANSPPADMSGMAM